MTNEPEPEPTEESGPRYPELEPPVGAEPMPILRSEAEAEVASRSAASRNGSS